jgi:hypothetical protein
MGKRLAERKITGEKTYSFKTKNLNSRPKTTTQEMPTVLQGFGLKERNMLKRLSK